MTVQQQKKPSRSLPIAPLGMDQLTEERFVDSTKGKGLFARRNIEVNEIILEEFPLVCCQFAWNEDCGYRCCEYCLAPLETAQENARRLSGIPNLEIPHTEYDVATAQAFQTCVECGTGYCSAACKDQSWNRYHKTLCHPKMQTSHPLASIRNTWKQMHFPPETFNVMVLGKLAAMFVQANPSDREEIMKSLARFQSDLTESWEVNGGLVHVIKLLGVGFQGQLETLRRLFSDAFQDSSVSTWWTPQAFLSLFAIFARNAQGVGTSSFGLWQKAVRSKFEADKDLMSLLDSIYIAMEEKTGEDFYDNEGSALYVRQRACNHSCSPNSKVSFLHNNFTLTLTAVQPIKMGEEILISYLSECDLHRSRHSRQKTLREYYLFNCGCHKCQEEVSQADVTSDEDVEGEWEDEEEEDAMQEE